MPRKNPCETSTCTTNDSSSIYQGNNLGVVMLISVVMKKVGGRRRPEPLQVARWEAHRAHVLDRRSVDDQWLQVRVELVWQVD